MGVQKIEGTEWNVEDWDFHWPEVYSCGSTTRIEVQKDGDVEIEHETRDYSTFRGYTDTRVYVPLAVLAEVLRRNGYNVSRTTKSTRAEVQIDEGT